MSNTLIVRVGNICVNVLDKRCFSLMDKCPPFLNLALLSDACSMLQVISSLSLSLDVLELQWKKRTNL